MCLCVFIFLQNCAPSRYVKPLKKNEKAVSFSFGGPVIGYASAAIPIPFTTAGFAKGLSDKLTAYAHVHPTSILFGNFQSDLGITYGLLNSEKTFGISLSPAIQQAVSLRHSTGFRVWPSLDANAYQVVTPSGSYLYAGVNTWFEISSTRAHEEPQPRHVIPNIHAGYTITGKKWNNLGAGIPVLPGVVDYKGINGKGSIGIYYSLIRKF
jgi:hypothetical protein